MPAHPFSATRTDRQPASRANAPHDRDDVIRFGDEEEAVEIANDVMYGLAAGVWTQNVRRAITMADRLQAGTVWVNTYRAISFMSPFGGYKMSGLGRENGADAIREYLQTKSVWISTASEVPNPFVLR